MIVGGCSREELFDAARLIAEARNARFVLKCIELPKEKTIYAQIPMVRSKDVTGDLWEIELFFQWTDVQKIGLKDILPDTVIAEYSTKTRKGTIVIP